MIFILITALVIGLSLSLLGAGGSLIAIPALSYLLHYSAQQAVAGSLFLVLVVSLFNMLNRTNNKNIHWPAVAIFALPGLMGAYAGAALSEYVTPQWQLLSFAFLALLASLLMLRPMKKGSEVKMPVICLLALALLLGALTGFIGVGAGFLLVPALVFSVKLEFNKAVATSLVLIAIQAASALAHYWQAPIQFDWLVMGLLACIAILGSFAGYKLRPKISQTKLTQTYSFCLILIASFTLWHNWPQPESYTVKTSIQLVQEARQQITEVSPIQAQQRVENSILIDVREPAEFANGHIKNAINIPRGVLEMEIEKLAPTQQLAQQHIYLYCRSGGRSALAALSLQNMGFDKVFSVAGGFQAWQLD